MDREGGVDGTREALREEEPQNPSRSFRLWPRDSSTGTQTLGFAPFGISKMGLIFLPGYLQ